MKFEVNTEDDGAEGPNYSLCPMTEKCKGLFSHFCPQNCFRESERTWFYVQFPVEKKNRTECNYAASCDVSHRKEKSSFLYGQIILKLLLTFTMAVLQTLQTRGKKLQPIIVPHTIGSLDWKRLVTNFNNCDSVQCTI